VDAAIQEKVDLVIFAGDAYRDRNPAPTIQREWGRRIMRLSRRGIPTLLLVGNHDVSPALNRAHALDPFDTLETPHVRVIERPVFLKPEDLEGLPVQVIGLPWISRSGYLAAGLSPGGRDTAESRGSVIEGRALQNKGIYDELVDRLIELVNGWLEDADPDLPVILTAHASIEGAVFGGERTVMLGGDLVLPASLVRDPRLDYVAMGHIHRPQNLNERRSPAQDEEKHLHYNHPPVIYPGSIERVDFGEAGDHKFYILAKVGRGRTMLEWRELTSIRPFIDRYVRIEQPGDVTEQLLRALPPQFELNGAITRLVIDYPREWDDLIDEAALRRYTAVCLEFHLVKRPQLKTRIRLPQDQAVGSLHPMDLLDLYWRANHTQAQEIEVMRKLAQEIVSELGLSEDERSVKTERT
jgi:exonuclease SbcD